MALPLICVCAVVLQVGAYQDVEKAIASRNLRRGKGKMRNRRYVMRKGPLVIYKEESGMVAAMRNVPGVELCSVERLNLLQARVPVDTFGATSCRHHPQCACSRASGAIHCGAREQ
jgi:Ribosomal protein L4/L1 family